MTQKPVNYGKYASFSRGDLIRTIEVLLERETRLLNVIASYERIKAKVQPVTPWSAGPVCGICGQQHSVTKSCVENIKAERNGESGQPT